MPKAMIYFTGTMLAGINAYLTQPAGDSSKENSEASTFVEAISAHLGGRSSTVSATPDPKVGKRQGWEVMEQEK